MLTWPVYYIAAPWLGLISDDWTHFRTALTHWQGLFTGWTTWQRPLEGVAWVLARTLFGTYLPGYYVLLFTLHLLAAWLLFLTLARIFPARWDLAFVSSTLFLVFPSDQSRFWLSTFAYRLGLVFLLLSVYLAVGARGRWGIAGVLSLVCYLCAILSNEIFLPLGLVPVLLLAHARPRRWRAIAGSALPFALVLAGYGAYRLGAPYLLHVVEGKASLFGASISSMEYKLLRVFQVNLNDAWLYAWRRVIGLNTEGRWAAVVAMAVVTGSLVLLWRTGKEPADEGCTAWMALAGGLGLMLLGYLSIMPTAYGVGLGSIDSRVNIAASPGAALAVGGAGLILADCVGRIFRRRWAERGILALWLTGLVLLAAGEQVAVRHDNTEAWAEQCSIWRQMLAQVPALKPDTYVIIAGVPRWRNAARILSASWEVTSALQLIYNNEQVRGDVIPADELPVTGEEDRSRIRFGPDSFSPRDSDEKIDYRHLIILDYQADGLVDMANVPPWAPKNLSELHTHPETMDWSPASAPIRRLLQVPSVPPW